MTNVKDRRREPKGIPTGGRFANENGGGMDASDLDEQEPAFDPKHLTDDDILALRHATGTITLGYVLEDETSPVTVEASGTFDMSGQKVTHEFALQ